MKDIYNSICSYYSVLQYCKYRLTLGTYNYCMTLSTIILLHTIHTWLANTARDTDFEVVLSYPPPLPFLSVSQTHTHLKKALTFAVINVSTT